MIFSFIFIKTIKKQKEYMFRSNGEKKEKSRNKGILLTLIINQSHKMKKEVIKKPRNNTCITTQYVVYTNIIKPRFC